MKCRRPTNNICLKSSSTRPKRLPTRSSKSTINAADNRNKTQPHCPRSLMWTCWTFRATWKTWESFNFSQTGSTWTRWSRKKWRDKVWETLPPGEPVSTTRSLVTCRRTTSARSWSWQTRMRSHWNNRFSCSNWSSRNMRQCVSWCRIVCWKTMPGKWLMRPMNGQRIPPIRASLPVKSTTYFRLWFKYSFSECARQPTARYTSILTLKKLCKLLWHADRAAISSTRRMTWFTSRFSLGLRTEFSLLSKRIKLHPHAVKLLTSY